MSSLHYTKWGTMSSSKELQNSKRANFLLYGNLYATTWFIDCQEEPKGLTTWENLCWTSYGASSPVIPSTTGKSSKKTFCSTSPKMPRRKVWQNSPLLGFGLFALWIFTRIPISTWETTQISSLQEISRGTILLTTKMCLILFVVFLCTFWNLLELKT